MIDADAAFKIGGEFGRYFMHQPVLPGVGINPCQQGADQNQQAQENG